MTRYEVVYMLIFLSFCIPGDNGYRDYGGTEFVFAFTEHYSNSIEDLFFTIINTNPFSVEINAKTPDINNRGVSQISVVDAYDVLKIEVNPDKVELQGSTVEQKSIRVTSTGNVVVIVFNRKKWSNDAYMVIPVRSTGTNYAAVTYCQQSNLCQIGVMANSDNTNVQFKIPDTGNSVTVGFNGINYYNGDSIDVTLNKYETVQIQSSDDLTGVTVTSNNPVTATSGATRTSFKGGNSEHFVDALIPNEHLGKEHIIHASHSSSIDDIVKIAAIYENTSFTISGNDFCNDFSIIKKGDKITYSMVTNYIYIHSKYPIVVAHFTVDGNLNGAMYFSTPIEKFNSEYFFYTPMNEFYSDRTFTYTNYVTVIVPKGTADSLLLDETTLPIGTNWIEISRTNFVTATIPLTGQPGQGHRIRHENNITFGGYIYGKGDAENYAFPLGYVFDTNYTVCDYSTSANCGTGDTVDVSCTLPETTTSSDTIESTVPTTTSPASTSHIDEATSTKSSISTPESTSHTDEATSTKSSISSPESTSYKTVEFTTTSLNDLPTSTSVESSSVHSTQNIVTTTKEQVSITNTEKITSSTEEVTTNKEITTNKEQVTTLTQLYSQTSSSDTCLCPCQLIPSSTLSNAEILKSIEKLKKELTIDPETTSAAIRKKISVKDPRPSAQAVGAAGIVILVIVFGGLILLDLTTLKREIEFFLSNVRNK